MTTESTDAEFAELEVSDGAIAHIEEELRLHLETAAVIQGARPFDIAKGPAAAALYRALLFETMQRVTAAIDATLKTLDDPRRELIRLRYWDEPWLTWSQLAERLNADPRTLQRWRSTIVEQIALRLGWR